MFAMSVVITLTCKVHPRYKAMQPPRCECYDCEQIWGLAKLARVVAFAPNVAAVISGKPYGTGVK